MTSKKINERIAEERKALFDEGLLGEQFEELETHQTPDDSRFVEDIFDLFLNEMGVFYNNLEKELAQKSPNIQVLDKVLQQIIGCTTGFGAKQLITIGNEMREHALKGEIQNCKDAFVRLENQIVLLIRRMNAYFELCKEVVGSGSGSAAKDGVKGKGKAQ